MLPLPPLPPPLRCNCCHQLSAAAELRRDCAAATTTNAAVLPLPLKSLLRCNRCAATYACAAAAAAAATPLLPLPAIRLQLPAALPQLPLTLTLY